MPSELAELLRAAEQRREAAHGVPVASQPRPWFRMEKKSDKQRAADVWIYDTIGESWFGESTSAKSFVAELADLDVDEITLHINSPGGDYFDGVAIYNALVDHPARVTSVVDGLAASAASFIAQAGDERIVNRAGQLMIHDASGIVIGNAADMADMVDLLDKISDSIAGIYASRAGGEVADWRTAMRAETWYTAAEAVDAGLADSAVAEAPSDPPVRNAFDLAVFNYAGRDKAPPPAHKPPAPPGKPRERSTPVAHELTDEQLAELRKKAGVADDASLDDTLAALPDQDEGEGDGDQPDGNGPANKAPRRAPAAESGTITIDAAAWQEREDRIKRLEAADAKRLRDERDKVIDQAIKDGKFPPARREYWANAWDKAPEETRELIDGLHKGVMPVDELGYGGQSDEDIDAEFASLWPAQTGKGR